MLSGIAARWFEVASFLVGVSMAVRTRRLMWLFLGVLPVTALVAWPGTRSDAAVAAPFGGLPRGAGLAQFGAPGTGVPGPDAPGSFDATLPNGRRVTPAGISVQVGQNPLNSVLTPDGRFLITSNDDERNGPARTGASVDPADTKNGTDKALSQYSLAITDTATMKIVSAVAVPSRLAAPNPGSAANGRTDSDNTNGLFLGLATRQTPAGYTLYASGGVADVVYKYTLGLDGTPAGPPAQIPVPVPTDKAQATYGMAAPGWLTLSAGGTTLYVVNNNGNSITPVDLSTDTPGTPVPVGYFPYAAQQVGKKLFVSNWGVTTRTFADGQGVTNPVTGVVTHAGTPFIGGGTANLFANPETSPQRSSSLSVLDLGDHATGSISLARPIDGVHVVGGTHPSALAVATHGNESALYVADANEDRIAIVDPARERLIRRIALPAPVQLAPPGARDAGNGSGTGAGGGVFGLSPDALATSPDQRTLFVAEAGLNSVAVYDVSRPRAPRFRGRIPTGWYPTGVTVSPDGRSLYITNAKGAGSPFGYQGTFAAPGSFTKPDVNWMFGSVQKVDLGSLNLAAGTRQVVANTVVHKAADAAKIKALQRGIKHVVYILRENKTYDTYFGDDAVLNARGADGNPAYAQYGPYVPNTKALAEQFTVADNSYADAEESNAGHSFALAATSTDFQQKTLLSRFSRPLVNIKNQDPEDYPLQGYIFNAMARNGRSFRDYGDNIRISGYDDGSAPNFCADDPKPACANPAYNNIQDTTSPTVGLGGLYSETLPAMKVLAGHLDENYPGWNLRISDQRRGAEFRRDFGHLIAQDEVPQFTFVWLPGDHTGSCTTNGIVCNPQQEVADNDAALGQLVDFISHSPVWRSTAIFLTEDDAQASPDHVSAHRSYISVISPWARRRAVVHSLSSTVSVPKTIEEILNLPAMSYGDLFANDLLDHFTTTPDFTPFTASTSVPGAAHTTAALAAPPQAQRIWELTARLDSTTYDADNVRLGQLTTLYFASLELAKHRERYTPQQYTRQQDALFDQARAIAT
jgi:DNA-binding beta-propeller fold protein YncE